MAQPLVSVAVPVYNGAQAVEKCLRSILGQTCRDLEVVVMDDGSTDETPELLGRLARTDARLRVYRQENSGVSTARNNAVRLCRGRYVHFTDADDSLPPDALEHMTALAEENASDLVIGAYTMDLGTLSEVKNLAKRDETVSMETFLSLLCKAPNTFYYGVLWNKLFRRELMAAQQVRFNPILQWGEDFDFITRYLVGAERITFTQKPVYHYVRNPRGLTVHTTLGVLRHPIRSIRLKHVIYVSYRGLYRNRRQYERHRKDIWKYMISTTLTE